MGVYQVHKVEQVSTFQCDPTMYTSQDPTNAGILEPLTENEFKSGSNVDLELTDSEATYVPATVVKAPRQENPDDLTEKRRSLVRTNLRIYVESTWCSLTHVTISMLQPMLVDVAASYPNV